MQQWHRYISKIVSVAGNYNFDNIIQGVERYTPIVMEQVYRSTTKGIQAQLSIRHLTQGRGKDRNRDINKIPRNSIKSIRHLTQGRGKDRDRDRDINKIPRNGIKAKSRMTGS